MESDQRNVLRRGTGLLHPGLPPLLIALRSLKAPSQGLGRETSTFPALSTPAGRLLDLPRLSQTLRAHLRPAHRRLATTLFPGQQTSTRALSQLDKLYQRVVQALDDLVHAVGLKAA